MKKLLKVASIFSIIVGSLFLVIGTTVLRTLVNGSYDSGDLVVGLSQLISGLIVLCYGVVIVMTMNQPKRLLIYVLSGFAFVASIANYILGYGTTDAFIFFGTIFLFMTIASILLTLIALNKKNEHQEV